MPRRYRPGRYFAQRDGNERPIIEALEAQGFHVAQISGVGVPDLLVSKQFASTWPGCATRLCWLVEVKMPKGKYKPAQIAFQEQWQGPPIITLRSVDDALKFQQLVGGSGR